MVDAYDGDAKIFGIGLPRSGGQSLQTALEILFPGYNIWHSPGNGWYRLDEDPKFLGAVEVFAPMAWLEDNYPGSLYIYNDRELDAWLKSCSSVYNNSLTWNHPLWKYPWSQFEAYRDEYLDERLASNVPGTERFLAWDITIDPSWEPLCEFLRTPAPDCPFPHRDKVKRPPRSITLPLPLQDDLL